MARRACPFDINVQIDDPSYQTISASHDGYQRLRGKPVHTRKWSLTDEHLLIEDKIYGQFNSGISHLHLHPDVSANLRENCIKICLPNGQTLELTVSGGIPWLEQSTWHPEFGKVIQSQKIIVLMQGNELVTKLRFTTG